MILAVIFLSVVYYTLHSSTSLLDFPTTGLNVLYQAECPKTPKVPDHTLYSEYFISHSPYTYVVPSDLGFPLLPPLENRPLMAPIYSLYTAFLPSLLNIPQDVALAYRTQKDIEWPGYDHSKHSALHNLPYKNGLEILPLIFNPTICDGIKNKELLYDQSLSWLPILNSIQAVALQQQTPKNQKLCAQLYSVASFLLLNISPHMHQNLQALYYKILNSLMHDIRPKHLQTLTSIPQPHVFITCGLKNRSPWVIIGATAHINCWFIRHIANQGNSYPDNIDSQILSILRHQILGLISTTKPNRHYGSTRKFYGDIQAAAWIPEAVIAELLSFERGCYLPTHGKAMPTPPKPGQTLQQLWFETNNVAMRVYDACLAQTIQQSVTRHIRIQAAACRHDPQQKSTLRTLIEQEASLQSLDFPVLFSVNLVPQLFPIVFRPLKLFSALEWSWFLQNRFFWQPSVQYQVCCHPAVRAHSTQPIQLQHKAGNRTTNPQQTNTVQPTAQNLEATSQHATSNNPTQQHQHTQKKPLAPQNNTMGLTAPKLEATTSQHATSNNSTQQHQHTQKKPFAPHKEKNPPTRTRIFPDNVPRCFV